MHLPQSGQEGGLPHTLVPHQHQLHALVGFGTADMSHDIIVSSLHVTCMSHDMCLYGVDM